MKKAKKNEQKLGKDRLFKELAFRKRKVFAFLLTINLIFSTTHALGLGYNYLVALAGPSRFSDFTVSVMLTKSNVFFDPRLLLVEPPFSYAMTPPLALLYKASEFNWILSLIALNVVSIFFMIRILQKKLNSLGFYDWSIFLLSFPVVFCLLRGGGDLWLAALCFYSYHLYERKRINISVLLLSLAVACKPHVLVFALLYLQKKDWASIAKLSISIPGIYVGSLILLNDFSLMDQLRVISQLSRNYYQTYAIGNGGLLWDSGLLGLQKSIYLWFPFSKTNYEDNIQILLIIQSLIAALLLMTAVFSVLKYRFELWDIWILSSTLIILVSPVSAIYKLVFLVPTLILEINKKIPRVVFVIILSMIVVPKTILWRKFSDGTEFTGDSLLNPILIIILYVLCIKWAKDENHNLRIS